MSDNKIRIEEYNMSEDMKLRAIEFVINKQKSKVIELELARELKKYFDDNFHPTWQCVVGKNFGSQIGFYDKHMIYFYWGNIAILLWKAG